MATLTIRDQSRTVGMKVAPIEDENGVFIRVRLTPKSFLDLHPDDAEVLAKRLMAAASKLRKVPDPRQPDLFAERAP